MFVGTHIKGYFAKPELHFMYHVTAAIDWATVFSTLKEIRCLPSPTFAASLTPHVQNLSFVIAEVWRSSGWLWGKRDYKQTSWYPYGCRPLEMTPCLCRLHFHSVVGGWGVLHSHLQMMSITGICRCVPSVSSGLLLSLHLYKGEIETGWSRSLFKFKIFLETGKGGVGLYSQEPRHFYQEPVYKNRFVNIMSFNQGHCYVFLILRSRAHWASRGCHKSHHFTRQLFVLC